MMAKAAKVTSAKRRERDMIRDILRQDPSERADSGPRRPEASLHPAEEEAAGPSPRSSRRLAVGPASWSVRPGRLVGRCTRGGHPGSGGLSYLDEPRSTIPNRKYFDLCRTGSGG